MSKLKPLNTDRYGCPLPSPAPCVTNGWHCLWKTQTTTNYATLCQVVPFKPHHLQHIWNLSLILVWSQPFYLSRVYRMDCFIVKGLARRGWLIHEIGCWVHPCSISLVMHSTHGYCSVLLCKVLRCRKTLMSCFMNKAMQAAPNQWLTCATTCSGSHTYMREKILLHGMKSKSWMEF